MASLNKTNVIVRNYPYISLTEALQWSKAPKTNVFNFEKPKIQIVTMDNNTNLKIIQRVNGHKYQSKDYLGFGSTII